MKPLKLFLSLWFLISTHPAVYCQQSATLGNLELFAQGLNKPVCIANAGDSRIFVVDQSGYIRNLDSLGNINPIPFLDIHGRVTVSDEQGLLGVAFHPQYSSNGYFYVNYTGAGDSTHLSRFSVSDGNPDVADPQSELKLMTIYQPYVNHNGGDVNFGPDGYLYMGLGDGGSAGDPGNRAQNLMVYLGKLLRIDVDHGNPYAIPPANPFYGSLSALGEIWAFGLRNPWRFSFDRLTGDLWIGDVGQDTWEEIDYQPADDPGGENYGWRCVEGYQPYNSAGCAPDSTFTFPVYTYPHDPECSVTGGYVYRGSTSSPYYGHYFFTDYCSDKIWTLHNAGGTWIKEDFGQFPGNNFSAFGEDHLGKLYVAGVVSGKIFRITVDTANGVSNQTASGLRVIQNPSSDKIKIETGRTAISRIEIRICDLRGSTLFSCETTASEYEFRLPDLSAGIYLLVISVDGKRFTEKITRMN